MGEPKHKSESNSVSDSGQQISTFFPFKHSLDVGNAGILVAWAQSKLFDHGFYEGEIDGRFTRALTLSVRKFQDSKKLMITGVIDRKTWDAL